MQALTHASPSKLLHSYARRTTTKPLLAHLAQTGLAHKLTRLSED